MRLKVSLYLWLKTWNQIRQINISHRPALWADSSSLGLHARLGLQLLKWAELMCKACNAGSHNVLVMFSVPLGIVFVPYKPFSVSGYSECTNRDYLPLPSPPPPPSYRHSRPKFVFRLRKTTSYLFCTRWREERNSSLLSSKPFWL